MDSTTATTMESVDMDKKDIPVCYHQYSPLQLFHYYYCSQQQPNYRWTSTETTKDDETFTKNTNRQPSHSAISNNLDQTLQVIDFLFGNPGSDTCTSLVDGAIQILDQHFSNSSTNSTSLPDDKFSTTQCRNDDNNQRPQQPRPRNTSSNTGNVILRLRSPNGRFVYIVSKNSSIATNKNRHPQFSSSITVTNSTNATISNTPDQMKDHESSWYLCILPDTTASLPVQSDNNIDEPLLCYCSCPSFLERSKACYNYNIDSNGRSSNAGNHSGYYNSSAPTHLCQHLLAIQLLPYFGRDTTEAFTTLSSTRSIHDTVLEEIIPTMEFVSEEDYSRAILQRVFH
jgi:hypothetical protein